MQAVKTYCRGLKNLNRVWGSIILYTLKTVLLITLGALYYNIKSWLGPGGPALRRDGALAKIPKTPSLGLIRAPIIVYGIFLS